MKSLKLILLFVLSPLTFFAQQQLSGLFMGELSNDSTTIRKDQKFEIVLAEYKGKVSGYSRTTFMVDDNLYYIVKRVKGEIKGDVCEVKDDAIISHNFPKRPEKGVKVISTFQRNKSDSNWVLLGDWKTVKTKKYYAISGKAALKEEKDLELSKIFPHLEELGLDKDIPYYATYKKDKEAAIVQESKKKAEALAKSVPATAIKSKEITKADPPSVETSPASIQSKPATEVVKKSTQPTNEENKTAVVKTETPPAINKPVAEEIKTEPVIAKANETAPSTIKEDKTNTVAVKNIPPQTNVPVTEEKKIIPVAKAETSKPISNPPVTTVKPEAPIAKATTPSIIAPVTEEKKIIPVEKNEPVAVKKIIDPTAPAAFINERVTDKPQEVTYVSDSLVLILYDNGEVDGDTVSVLLNGEILMAKQGLKTAAIRKTIYIAPGNEEMTLLLYAENLGKYPPNTGLLVIYDGEERYQLRFSADLNRNASIVFRRKK